MTESSGSSGWNTLLAVVREAREQAATEAEQLPVACPNDGEPLLNGPDGGLYCPYDGYRPQ